MQFSTWSHCESVSFPSVETLGSCYLQQYCHSYISPENLLAFLTAELLIHLNFCEWSDMCDCIFCHCSLHTSVFLTDKFIVRCISLSTTSTERSQDSAVGRTTGYGLDDRGVGVRVPVGSRIFSSPRRPDQLWGPPSLYPIGAGDLSLGVKRPGREVDHSPLTNTEVKKMWIYTSTPIRLHGVVLNYLSTGTALLFTASTESGCNELVKKKTKI
jgi:hypothetical protein